MSNDKKNSKTPGFLAKSLGAVDSAITRPGRYVVGAAGGAGAGAAVSHFTDISPVGMAATAGIGAGVSVVANGLADWACDKDEYDAVMISKAQKRVNDIDERVEKRGERSESAVRDLLAAM